jgi:glycosyltransferase involved in cell wall biosynthesis
VRVLLVSGIWPPDVGGPATHAPEVAEGLLARGHEVEVVTTASAPPPPAAFPVRWVRRSLPPGVRHAAVVAEVARRARRADVVYATSMVGRASLATMLARRPLVAKLAGDPAYERSRRRGLYGGDLAGFQQQRGGARITALRLARDLALRRAAHVVCPSGFLRDIALGWGLDPARVSVVPNASPSPPGQLPEPPPLDRPALAFAGRLTAAKSLGVLLDAVARVEGVSLVVAGDGEERERVAARAAELGLDGRVRLAGALPREEVLALLAAADAVVLSSAWENFPHVLVEALALGTPVIATRVGGVPEIVEDGVSGLLVPPGDADALAGAVRRFLADEGLRARLREGARKGGARFAPDALLDRLEGILRTAAGSAE